MLRRQAKKAIRNYSIAEGYSAQGEHGTAEKFHNKSGCFCGDALAVLWALVHINAGIQRWF